MTLGRITPLAAEVPGSLLRADGRNTEGIHLSGKSPMVRLARNRVVVNHGLASNDLTRVGRPVSYCADLRLPFSRPGSGFFAVATIPAARSFAIRPMSFTGTGLVRGNWTVPFRSA